MPVAYTHLDVYKRQMLEDAGYFCVDNLPVPFIDKFAELTASGNSEITKVAIGIDIRSGKSLSQLEQILEHLTAEHITYEILFLDCLLYTSLLSAGGVCAFQRYLYSKGFVYQ